MDAAAGSRAAAAGRHTAHLRGPIHRGGASPPIFSCIALFEALGSTAELGVSGDPDVSPSYWLSASLHFWYGPGFFNCFYVSTHFDSGIVNQLLLVSRDEISRCCLLVYIVLAASCCRLDSERKIGIRKAISQISTLLCPRHCTIPQGSQCRKRLGQKRLLWQVASSPAQAWMWSESRVACARHSKGYSTEWSFWEEGTKLAYNSSGTVFKPYLDHLKPLTNSKC